MTSHDNGIITKPSTYSVQETADRFESLITSKGIKVFARIDQKREAQSAGLDMPETILIIFGDPKTGTPLMVKHPSIAMDLPLKVLISEGSDGKTLVSYNSPRYLMERHDLESEPFKPVESLIDASTS